jgi:putative DNA primase/helicase
MTLAKVLERFPDAKKSGNGWMACCPAHDDKSPSLSINEGDDGRVLLNCFGEKCSVDAICESIGLKPADLFSKTPLASMSTKPHRSQEKRGNRRRSEPETDRKVFDTSAEAVRYIEDMKGREADHSWTYHDASGEPVGIVLRWNRSNGKKDYLPVSRYPDGWQTCGMPDPRPLYCLPELLGASRVFVCEGEKSADAARSIGLVATTSANGSQSPGKTDWTPLAGKEVAILADNDKSGRKYREAVTAKLLNLDPPAVVKAVELPGLPDKGDIFDWVEMRGDAVEPEELRKMVEGMADLAEFSTQPKSRRSSSKNGHSEAVFTRLSDVVEEEVAWLWPGRIPLGKITLMAGDPGLGKSFVTIDMAARVSTGMPWPDCPDVSQPMGTIVMFNCEDGLADTVVPRLKQAGGDLSRVIAIEGVQWTDDEGMEHQRGFSLDRDLPELIEVLKSNPDTRLVVIDPISAYCGGTDSHKNSDVRGLLAPLAQMASQYRVAVVMVTHHSKGSGGKAVHLATGSVAFAATSRAVWNVMKDHDDHERRLILLSKINVCKESTGMAYRLIDGRVCWEDSPVQMTADEHLALEETPKQRSAGSGAALKSTQEWLSETLANQSMLASHMYDLADDVSISTATLKRAKKGAGVRSERIGFGRDSACWWTIPLPAQTADDDIDIDDLSP